MSAYVTATVTCGWCSWAARLSGETEIEVGRFLRVRLLEHVLSLHPERLEPEDRRPS